MVEKEYAIWLSSIEGVGRARIMKLIDKYGSVEEVYKLPVNIIMEEKILGLKAAEKMVASRDINRIKRNIDKMQYMNINFTYYGDEKYPEKLMDISNAPFSIFYKGRLPDSSKKSVAIVGARNADNKGYEFARKFGREMAENGVQVISGLANGIDGSAHKGCLDVINGHTFGVLGCGVDICYPKGNICIYNEMQKNGGVISEYMLGTQPFSSNFPMRNRIISGLSDAVLVIEAGRASGSLITAGLALDQGKDVLVIPGDITNPLFEGSNYLIKNGAMLVSEIKDILDALGIFVDDSAGEIKKKKITMLSEEERKIYRFLSLEPIHISQINVLTGLKVHEVMKILILMESKGIIKDTGNQFYSVVL